ncbi:MAG TPA: IS110 family transposase [Armatimonadota bacterium]
MDAYIGIDVSKDTLDVCLMTEGCKDRLRTFPNRKSGYRQLLDWANRYAPNAAMRFCLEATGSYSDGIAFFLAEEEQWVSVINPYRAKHHGQSKGPSNKTDQADARLLADFCRTQNPSLWRPAAPEVRLLTALSRRLESIIDLLGQEENRAKVPNLQKEIERSLKITIRQLSKERERIERQIRDHIRKHPDLKRDRDLLLSIPGIGETTAWIFLAELPDPAQFESAEAAAAFCGLNPRQFRSGSSVHKKTRLAKTGNARLRKALYFPALTAARHNPLVAAFAQRLLLAGKPAMVVLGASMRKLLMIAYGVLNHRRPFSPSGYIPAA